MTDRGDRDDSARAALGRTLLVCLSSLLVMLPWPLAGIAAVHAQFDEWSEALFMLGGVTAIPAMVVALFGAPDSVYAAVLVVVWIAAWLTPPIVWVRQTRRLRVVLVMLGAQAGFALLQAMAGAMLVIGKSVWGPGIRCE